jgi:dihydroflavonol-4-reductase
LTELPPYAINKPAIMRIAITGASGHIGVNLCRFLVREGHSVRGLIHKNSASLEGIHIEKVSGDLMNPASLSSLVQDMDIVFHLAGVISIWRRGKKDVFEKNVEGTRNILAASIKASVKRLIHFSSIHALAHDPFDKVLDETRPLAIHNQMAYRRSKAYAEKEVLKGVAKGLDAVILNPTAVIGPEDHEPSLMGRALILMSLGKLPFLVPGGYDWVDVRDVVQAASTAMFKGRKGERYLLSAHWRELKTIADMVSAIEECTRRRMTCPHTIAGFGLPLVNLYCRITNTDALYTRDSLRTLRTSHRYISHEKASRELDYAPRPLMETLRNTLDWFKAQKYLSC